MKIQTRLLTVVALASGWVLPGMGFADSVHHVVQPSAGTSTTGTSSETVPESPPANNASMTKILDDAATLKSQESEITAQQKNAEINSVKAQAKESGAQAKDVMKGANMQMKAATVQAAQQGVSQTQEVSEQLRQNQSSVAQDEANMVQSVH